MQLVVLTHQVTEGIAVPQNSDPTQGNDSFEQPPVGRGRGGSTSGSDDEEAGLESFASPDDRDTRAGAESAEMDASSFVSSVDARLLELKRAVEDRMSEGLERGATSGARSFDAMQGVGNIVGVGIGIADPQSVSSAGAPGEQALNLYVIEPTTHDEARGLVAQVLGVRAANADDVPVNVIVTGHIDAQAHRFRMRPSPCGISVGHYKITAGTQGALAVGRSAPRNNRVLMLSNNHVIANTNAGVYGDCICQPGPIDGGKCPADQVAILERFVPINFVGANNYVDCATGWCWSDRVRREQVYLSGGSPALYRTGNAPVAPFVGMIVGKSGRTTQLTQGRVMDVSATINVNYGGGRVARFVDQITIQSTTAGAQFSAGGDSGSLIWQWNAARMPVGLLFAGGGSFTFANKIRTVLNSLDINLLT